MGAVAIEALLDRARDSIAALRSLAVKARTYERVGTAAADGVRAALELDRDEPIESLDAVFDALCSAPAPALAEALVPVLASGLRRWTSSHMVVIARALTAEKTPDGALSASLSLYEALGPNERAQLLLALQHWPAAEPALVALAARAAANPSTTRASAALLLAQSKRGAEHP
jgi:hypothetical protein